VNFFIYIYYRVQVDASTELLARVRAAQSTLARETGVQGRLLRRADDASTWMEVYEPVSDHAAFMRALERALDQAGVYEVLVPETRNNEVFRLL
jgi:hypothetical protein